MTAVRDMFALMFGRCGRRGRLAVLTAYFDDSGTHDGSPVVLMGGLLGDEAQWTEFEANWAKTLLEPTKGKGPIRRFHAFDCQNAQGEFAGWNRADSDSAFYNFRKVILDCGVLGYVVAIESQPWEELIRGPLRVFFGDAERYCVSQAILCTAMISMVWRDQEPIKFVFDNRGKRNDQNKVVMDVFEKFHSMESELPPIEDFAFLSSSNTLPLQGADLVAYEYYSYVADIVRFKNSKADPRKHWQRLYESGKITGQMALRPSIEQMAAAHSIDPTIAKIARDHLGL